MKAVFTLLFLGLFVVSCNPVTTIKYSDVQLGSLKFHDTISGVAKIKNTGLSKLTIRKIVASCECTIVEADSSEIAAGSDAQIKFKIGLKKTGHFSKKIMFEANTKEKFHSFIVSGYTVN